ncbi:MAG: family 78 glycoside hydrolase catalytic domain [Fimbriimonas sp.]|nr:family 78 glycoside hydrolase catalytic domain [Fimbriimonas sp.]
MLCTLAALTLLAVGNPSESNASFKVVDLRCEHLIDPACIDVVKPRLSWRTEAASPDWRQSGYRIIVSSSEAELKKDVGDLWDSGKIESSESVELAYGGKPLTSNEACFWKVQEWDSAGHLSLWSRAGKWEMGFLSPEDWGPSLWIGNGQAGPAPFLRRDFTLRGAVKRARLFAAGLGYEELHLNGRVVAHSGSLPVERDPGYTNFDKRDLYVGYDVAGYLKPGKNCLGAILGTGWYDVHDVATWHFERASWRGRPRARILLSIEYRDGSLEEVVSDSSWKTSTGPILTDGIYTGETYDARKELTGWDRQGYDDSHWTTAAVMDSPKGKLVACSCPPIVIGETIKPVAIVEPKPGAFIVDFGQNFSGHSQIKVTGPAGTTIRMRYSERVGKDGMIERSQIETFMDKTTPPQPFQTDTYICRGQGSETWEQRFSYSGFRYMEVTGFPGTPTLDNFRGRFAHTDLKAAGSFACSNDLLNKIQHATRYSYLSNAQSIFTDCPQREKNGWTGDAHLAAEAGLMNFDSISLYEKWLDDLADEQFNDGRNSIIVPTWSWGAGGSHPAWDSAYPIIVNDLYHYSNDRAIVEKHYDRLKRYVDGLAAQTKDGVIPFDSLGDWVPWSTETSSQLTSTAFLYLDASIVASFARIQDRAEDIERYTRLAERTQKVFNDVYFDPAKGVYANGSQAALSTALYFGLVPEDRKPLIFQALVADVERQGHIDSGIIGAKNVLRVLSEGGRTDLAYKLVARKEIPGWGYWMEQGATTLWEDWKGESSLNHIMFGDVSNWFIQWIAGIGLDPQSPGFRHIVIHPQPVGDLTWAKATHASPDGLIESSWRREGNRFKLSVTIPPNCTATIILPGSHYAGVEIGSGKRDFDVPMK